MNSALVNAQSLTKDAGGNTQSRGLFSSSSGGSSKSNDFVSLISQLPGIGDGLAREAKDLQQSSAAQQQENARSAQTSRSAFGSSDNANVVPGMSPDFDPVKTAGRIYPILQFRDKIVKSINRFIAKVPGLEKLMERISETLTAFIMGLLAPFIQPIVQQLSKSLKTGSSGLLGASSKTQFEPWDNPRCDDPTHSMLSKDVREPLTLKFWTMLDLFPDPISSADSWSQHFTNILNSCAGRVATTILQYCVPRILFAWENPGVPVSEVTDDILRALHHPVMRDEKLEIHRNMFNTVREWADKHPRRHQLNNILSSGSVKNHKNHVLNQEQHSDKDRTKGAAHSCGTGLGHSKTKNGLWSQIKTRDLNAMEGQDNKPINSAPASGAGNGREFGYKENQDQSHIYKGSSTGAAADYYGGSGSGPTSSSGQSPMPPQPSYGQPPPQHGYGRPPPQPSYGGPPPPQPGYGGPPPPGHWGGPPPPGPYSGPPGPPGPGYGQPPPQSQYPPGPYGQGPPPPGYQQGPPPPGWGGGYPGQRRY